MIKNIVFDLGNVILKETPSSVLEKILSNENDRKIIDENVLKNSYWKELDYGTMTIEEFNDITSKNIPERLRKKSETILYNLPKYREYNTEVIELIKQLKKKKYKIYILSNNNIYMYNYLKTTELNKYIDGWVVSALYNTVKPNKELYEIMFKKYKLIPSECFFIDDKQENIETGENLGMKGFTLNLKEKGFSKLIEKLNENEISV